MSGERKSGVEVLRKIRNNALLVLCCFVVRVALASPAIADSTYVYTGAAFTNCTVNQTIGETYYVDNACPTGPGITMSVTFENALPDNASSYTPSEVAGFVLTAQGYSVDFPDSTVTPFADTASCDQDCAWYWSISTDAFGNITNVNITLDVEGVDQVTLGSSGDSFYKGSCSGGGSFECFNFSNTVGGQWVLTPEPNTLILSFTGILILLLGGAIRRRRGGHSAI